MNPEPGSDPAASLDALLVRVRACTICAEYLPLGPRPVLQAQASARVLVASQAPGRKVHESGVPFDDASGDRLRIWMGVSREVFYDASRIAIVPIGLCYPGKGPAGDLPPRPECAPTWRDKLMAGLPNIQLTLAIGSYAQAWHSRGEHRTVTQAVRAWESQWPTVIPLPHPSARNNLWLRRNPWFAEILLPRLRERVASVLAESCGALR